MAVTRDTIQLNVEIITPESRSLAQANKRLASIPNSIRKAIREGEGLERQMKEIASAGKLVEGIDLTKVAPAQVATRAKQLGAILKQIPSSAPGVAKLRAEYKALNDRLADIRQESRGVASAFRGRGQWRRLPGRPPQRAGAPHRRGGGGDLPGGFLPAPCAGHEPDAEVWRLAGE
jgi:hypothetical protein